MGAALFIAFGLSVLLFGIPTLTYFHAKHLGRRPWLWFALGFVLPIISTLLLSLLPDLSEDEIHSPSK
jgi:MFS family permease